MGILKVAVDKIRKLFKKPPVIDPTISPVDENEKYWTNEWVEHPVLTFIYPIEYNNSLAIKKQKSQKKNWSKWKNKKII